MLTLIISSIYFMIPAYVANALPVIGNYLNIFPTLNIPVDRGKTLHKRPLFGRSKTVRGFFIGIIGAILIGLLQFYLYKNNIFLEYALIKYSITNSLLIGFLLGAGALIGDLLKSFIKRRLGIKSGKPWIIADQIDYVIGSLILISPFYFPPLKHVFVICIISPLFSVIANIFSYLTGMKKVWW